MVVPQPLPRARRVLLVDDDTRSMGALAMMLRQDGYEVDMRSDGISALDYASHTPPDVLVTDLQLPGLGGMALLRALEGQLASCEVFVLTAYPDWSSTHELARLNVRRQFIKPVEYDLLLSALRCAPVKRPA